MCWMSCECLLQAGGGLKVTKRVRPRGSGAVGRVPLPPAWFPTCVITGTNRQTHDNTATHGALNLSGYLYYLLKYSGLLDILNVQVGSTSGTSLLDHLNRHANLF